jgi:hypothetical protein
LGNVSDLFEEVDVARKVEIICQELLFWGGFLLAWNEDGSAHQGGVTHVAVSPGESWLVSYGKDECVRLWQLLDDGMLPKEPIVEIVVSYAGIQPLLSLQALAVSDDRWVFVAFKDVVLRYPGPAYFMFDADRPIVGLEWDEPNERLEVSAESEVIDRIIRLSSREEPWGIESRQRWTEEEA